MDVSIDVTVYYDFSFLDRRRNDNLSDCQLAHGEVRKGEICHSNS
jgi:hypothetical protein